MKAAKNNRSNAEAGDFDFLEINPDDLWTEWQEQPALYFVWAHKLADSRFDHEEAKANLDVVRAELSRAIRDDPADYGLDKVTEAGVTAAIPEQAEYIEALREVREARHAMDVYGAAVTALDHRKRALEKLVEMDTRGYHATPKEPEVVATDNGRRDQRPRGVRKRKG